MELSNEVYTTSSANFGAGFAFPQIDFALKGIVGDEPSDLDIEGLGHPEDLRVSYIGGAPIEQDEDGAEILNDGDDVGGGSEIIAEEAGELSGYIGLTGFDPTRAGALADELGEELVSLARKIAEELGAEADPTEFLAEFRARQVELTNEDRDILDCSRRLGGLADPQTEAASVCRLASAGEANLRLVEGELLLIPAGADPALVAEAARRSREAREGRSRRQANQDCISRALKSLAGAPASLEALTGRLEMSPAEGKDLLRKIVRGGEISCRKVGERVILGEMGMSARDAHRTAAVARAAEKASFANMKESARRARKRGSKAFPAPMVPFGGTKVAPAELPKVLELERARTAARDSGRTEARVEHPGSWDCEIVAGSGGVHVLPVYRREADVFLGVEGAFHCWPVSETIVVNDPESFFANQLEEEQTAAKLSRRAVRRTEAAATDPADKLPEAERESGPDQRGASAPREYRDSDRGGEALLASKGATNPSRTDRQRKDAQRRVNRALAKGEISPSRRAWNTALAIHLGQIENLAERLELMLQTKGRQEWKKLEKGSSNPAELKAAARQLADAGRLKALRGRQSGSLHIEAVAELSDAARKELERALLRLMVTGRVPVPKGTRLARRVAAHRGVLRREARKKEGTA